MASGVRINWRVIVPLALCLGIVLYIGLSIPGTKSKVILPHTFKDIHDVVGDGSPKGRRRPDLNVHAKVSGLAKDQHPSENEVQNIQRAEGLEKRLHVAVVACGDRAKAAIMALKSFAIFSRKLLKFHIFTEDNLQAYFLSAISKWPGVASGHIIFDIQRIQYPDVKDPEVWKTMFKPCATERLFLPLLLKGVDAVLYVDTDVLSLVPLEDIWSHFSSFNATHLATLSPESEVETIGWYNRFARHPYYGKLGLNSGVMLMNLTRMRDVKFFEMLMPWYEKFKSDIVWGDQDLLNIAFHFHPEMVLSIPCNWNFRTDHCSYGSLCKESEKEGVFLVHGSRGVFHSARQPEFKVIYNAIEKYDLASNNIQDVKEWISEGLEQFKSTNCGALGNSFVKAIK